MKERKVEKWNEVKGYFLVLSLLFVILVAAGGYVSLWENCAKPRENLPVTILDYHSSVLLKMQFFVCFW